MSYWKIRDLERDIEKLEEEQKSYSRYDDEWNKLEKKLDDLRDELRKLKKRKEEDEKRSRPSVSSTPRMFNTGGFKKSGGFGGFGRGGFGGGGAGGKW